MNIKLKFTLIILAILLLGIAIGFEISEISVNVRQKELHSFREANGFLDRFENIIQPDAEQKPVISSILLKYHKLIDSTSKASITQVSNLIDSMVIKLKQNLKEDQIERIEKEISRMKNGPPPPFNQGPNPGQGFNPNMGPNPNQGLNPNMGPRPNPGDMNRPGPFDQGNNKLLKPTGNKPPDDKRPPNVEKR
jgi:hypothetical protein